MPICCVEVVETMVMSAGFTTWRSRYSGLSMESRSVKLNFWNGKARRLVPMCDAVKGVSEKKLRIPCRNFF